MADHFEDDPAAQLRREIRDEIYRDAGFSPAAQEAAMRAAAQLVEADRQAATDQQRRSEVEADEEERRRAGRGGGGNPANASHSLNIRPDVVEGPAGLEVRTTMKSADYPASPGLEADLAEVAHGAREEREPLRERVAQRGDAATAHDDAPPRPKDGLEAHLLTEAPHGLDDDAQHIQVIRRANEESTKRQEAERAARSGEPVPGDPASSATPSLAADLRAAEKAAKIERETEGQEAAPQDHREGKTPGGGGGRGIF